jgi:hypothetical protein
MLTFIEQIRDITVPKNMEKYIGAVVAGNPKKTVDYVNIDDIQLPEEQRDYSLANIYKNIQRKGGIDYNLFGIPTIRRKPSTGELSASNGQHRIIKQILFDPDNKEILCEIIEIEDDKQAAEYFADVNALAIRKLNKEEIFWAQVLAGDRIALHHKSLLELADVSIGKVNQTPGRKKLKYANFLKAINHSEQGTIRAIWLLKECYPNNEIKSVVMSALALLFSLPEYKSLMDRDTKIGETFETWFLTKGDGDYGYFDFTEYRDGSLWHYGVAYGIAQKFLAFARGKGMSNVPNLKYIKEVYTKHGGSHAKGGDDDS